MQNYQFLTLECLRLNLGASDISDTIQPLEWPNCGCLRAEAIPRAVSVKFLTLDIVPVLR